MIFLHSIIQQAGPWSKLRCVTIIKSWLGQKVLHLNLTRSDLSTLPAPAGWAHDFTQNHWEPSPLLITRVTYLYINTLFTSQCWTLITFLAYQWCVGSCKGVFHSFVTKCECSKHRQHKVEHERDMAVHLFHYNITNRSVQYSHILKQVMHSLLVTISHGVHSLAKWSMVSRYLIETVGTSHRIMQWNKVNQQLHVLSSLLRQCNEITYILYRCFHLPFSVKY